MAMHPRSPDFLKDPSARTLVAGDLEAVFLPDHGMLGASLRYKGVEILRRVEDLEAAAARGSSAGIPLLYPWANRLAEPRYRVLGQEVVLDKSSPLLHFDEHGLPMHGVPWPLLRWVVSEARQDFMAAQLDWFSSDLLALFPFRHRVELAVTLASRRPHPGNDGGRKFRGTGPGELWFSSLLRLCRAFARELASGTTGDAETSTRQAWNPDR